MSLSPPPLDFLHPLAPVTYGLHVESLALCLRRDVSSKTAVCTWLPEFCRIWVGCFPVFQVFFTLLLQGNLCDKATVLHISPLEDREVLCPLLFMHLQLFDFFTTKWASTTPTIMGLPLSLTVMRLLGRRSLLEHFGGPNAPPMSSLVVALQNIHSSV